jgi:predicted CoA-binding protein
MATRAQIDEFLSHKDLALVRPSASIPVRGGRIDDELNTKGYKISVVYLDGPDGTAKLGNLPQPVEGAIIAVPKDKSEQAVREAIDAKVPRLWIQNGCDSPAAVDLAAKSGVPLVYGHCVMMYAEPVQSVHAFHRWMSKLFGNLAQ